jgi:hypothetical protein
MIARGSIHLSASVVRLPKSYDLGIIRLDMHFLLFHIMHVVFIRKYIYSVGIQYLGEVRKLDYKTQLLTSSPTRLTNASYSRF